MNHGGGESSTGNVERGVGSVDRDEVDGVRGVGRRPLASAPPPDRGSAPSSFDAIAPTLPPTAIDSIA
jgi:hypothetical protein